MTLRCFLGPSLCIIITDPYSYLTFCVDREQQFSYSALMLDRRTQERGMGAPDEDRYILYFEAAPRLDRVDAPKRESGSHPALMGSDSHAVPLQQSVSGCDLQQSTPGALLVLSSI